MVRDKIRIRMTIFLCVITMLIGIFAIPQSATAKSDLPYYIKVNKQQNCVTVYKKDKKGKYTIPVKAMVCSVGNDTPLGVFKTPEKYRWRLLMGDVWGQYSTRIVGGILFHSVWYYEKDASTLSAVQYNKLGTTASHGCVRLTVADAKWIYDNCPLGTTVEIYNSKDPGPLGKPEAIKIPTNSGWDPTDPSDKNPYKKAKATITGVSNKSIAWGTSFDLRKGLKATSSTGMDITKSVTVKGTVNTYKAGKYKITYSVKDALGKKASKTITITVKESTESPVIKGVKDKVVGKDTVIDRKFAINGVTAYLSKVKLSKDDIKVSIKKVSDDKYTVTYTVKVGSKETKAKSSVYIDTTAPVISGITFKELTKEQLDAGKTAITKLALKDITVSDDHAKLTTKDIKVLVDKISDYSYQVTYKLSDSVGNTFSETVQFIYFSNIKIEGVSNVYDIPYGTLIDEEFVLQGIDAYDVDGQDYTDKIAVDIITKDNILYWVTYSVENVDGSLVQVTCKYKLADKPADYVEPNSNEDTEGEDTSVDNKKIEEVKQN